MGWFLYFSKTVPKVKNGTIKGRRVRVTIAPNRKKAKRNKGASRGA